VGLFDIFKKKPPSHQEKVNLAYSCYKQEMVGMIFPGKQVQASNIIISMAKIYKLDLNLCDAKKYYDILTTYSNVLIRRVITQSSDEHIIQSLQVKHGELVKNKEVAKQVLAFVALNMNNNNFTLNSEKELSILYMVVDSFSQMEQTTSENVEAENANLDDPEYGLVVTKPIYTQGVNGSDKYLQSLRTTLGEKLTWKRIGATSSPEINGMIDIYEGTLPSGKIYKTLYLNMYGSKNSTKIPKGFTK